MEDLKKWENFLGWSLQGMLGAELRESLQKIPVEHRDSLNIVIKRAIQYGGMTEEEIDDVLDGPQELPEITS